MKNDAGSGPLFTIITPAYNCGEKIDATIRSVLAQDPGLFEYLVIDGDSSDSTMAEVRKHGPAIRSLSEKDRGVYDAMNKGISLAHGRYLYFIGAGDTLRPGALQRVAAHIQRLRLEKSTKPCFIYGDVFSEEMQRSYGGRTGKLRLGFHNICHQGIFYDRRIFGKLSGYDLKYRILADYHLNLRCYGADWIRRVRINELVANYETAGLSSAVDRDFSADQASLVRQHLGLPSLLVFKLRFRWLWLYRNYLAR